MKKRSNVIILFFNLTSFMLYAQGNDLPLSVIEQQVDSLIQDAIQNKAFPGAQVLIFKKDSILLNKSYGYQTYDSIKSITNSNLYDLASVTKVLAGTLAIMKLYELYNIDLKSKVSNYIPSLKRTNKKNTSFKEVLSHSGGWLPYIAHQNLVRKKNGAFKRKTLSPKLSNRYPIQISDSLFIHKKYKNKIMRRIKKSKVGTVGNYLYSGLWFFLIPELTKKLSGYSFTDFLDTYFYSPLELERLTFLPTRQFSKDEIVPTEIDPFFRQQRVQGWVHDEAAAMMGGISGNAGLFANASSIAPLLKLFLNKGTMNNTLFLKPQTLKIFTQRAYPKNGNRRGLGFDKPSIEKKNRYPSSTVSPQSFGHSGFTGTFIWVDPIDNSFVIFLSNRVYPSREQRGLYNLDIRRKLLDLTLEY